jgi:hypothetical protein
MNYPRVNYYTASQEPSYPCTHPPLWVATNRAHSSLSRRFVGIYSNYRKPLRPPPQSSMRRSTIAGRGIVIADVLFIPFDFSTRRCGSHRGSVFSSTPPIQVLAFVWSTGDGRKQKTHWGTSFGLGCRINAVPIHVRLALTKPAPQWVCECRFIGATTSYQFVDSWIIHTRPVVSTTRAKIFSNAT